MSRVAAAGASAAVRAAAAVTLGVVASVSGEPRVWLTPSQAPFGPWWTTRSPPSTGSPP